jgi:serine protease Do
VESAADRFGFSVQDLTAELRDQLKAPAGSGVVVSGVEDGGPAARAGLRPGDIIAEANRERVRSAQEFTRLLGQMKRGSNLLLLVQREGNSRFVVLTPKQP